MPRITGAKAVIETLKQEKTRYIFGLPGSTDVPIRDELADCEQIEYILATHEGAATSIADGYAKATQKPSFVIYHAGPGTTPSISALYNAYINNTPLVMLGCTVDDRILIHEPPYWPFNMTEMVDRLVKWRWNVSNTSEIVTALRRAIKVADSYPKGPVYLALPRNFLEQESEIEIVSPSMYHLDYTIRSDAKQIEKAADILLNARNPIIFAGFDIETFSAMPELVKLAEILAIPVTVEHNYPNKCVIFPRNHPLYLGAYNQNSNMANACDVFFGIGCKMFIQRRSPQVNYFPKTAKVIHMGNDPWEIAKSQPVDAGIVSDIKKGLSELIDVIRSRMDKPTRLLIQKRFNAIHKIREKMQESMQERLKEDWDAFPIKGSRLVRELYLNLRKNVVIVNEAVMNSSYLRYYDFTEPYTLFGSIGSLGWGVPASVGIQMALPKKKVVCLVGDGSFLLGVQGLWTAARYKIPVIFVVCNNKSYNATKWYLIEYNRIAASKKRWVGCDLLNPEIDYVKIAEGYGLEGERIEKPSDIAPSLRRASKAGRPYVLDVIMDPRDIPFNDQRVPE